MCGIVGAVAQKDVTPILLEGLKRLEYRGYDSCGVAVHMDGKLQRSRSTSRVAELQKQVAETHLAGFTGIAHTRWATHGAPATHNAHPHFSRDRIALVHNGIIENYEELRTELQSAGYVFESQTDTEVIAHLVDHMYTGDLFETVQQAVRRLTGAYAIAVFCVDEPHRVVVGRHHRPDRLPRRRRRRRPATATLLDRRRQRQTGRTRSQNRTRLHQRGRTRPLSALHAKGNFRTTPRHCRHTGRR